MNEEQITQQIKQIKQLIVDRRFKKAFAILAEILEEVDRLDQEDVDDVELENKMLMIRSRFNTFNEENIKGIQTDKSEINRITLSILQFLDEVKEIAIEYATLPAQIEKPSTDYTNPQETVATGVLTNVPATPQEERNGCLIAFANKDTNVNIQMRNFSPAKTILSIGAVIFAFGLLFFLFRTGCYENTKPITPTPDPGPSVVVVDPPPFGPDANSLGLPGNSMEGRIADHLSNSKSTFPKEFNADEIRFTRNSTRLSAAARAQLDELVALLKAYPDVTIDIYGYLTDQENPSYQGSKELALDDVRARSAYDYLKSRGIDESRLSFMGNGSAAAASIGIQLNKR